LLPSANGEVVGGGGQVPLAPQASLLPEERVGIGLRTLKLHARGDDFRIVQLQGNLFVCSPENGNCCCGRPEKGRMAFANRLYEQEWESRHLRSQVHLTFSGCLGPCAVGNNALLQIMGRSLWFKDLNQPKLIPALFDYIEVILRARQIVLPPPTLQDHLYERYIPVGSPGDDPLAAMDLPAPEDGGGERLDPVCLMDVDPATAKHFVEYQGRTVYFCAPSCKRLFLNDPAIYLPA
jgi:cobaltochelatase CobN